LKQRSAGLSLAETLVALFLLAGGALACLTLLISAGRNQQLTLETLQATRLAQQCQERILAWAEEPAHYASLASVYADHSLNDPAYPGMTARIQANPAESELVSPNTSLETPFLPDIRRLSGRCRALLVTVNWTSNRPRSLSLQALVPAPIQLLASPAVTITWVAGSSSPMAQNATATYEARLMDGSNQPIPGVFFEWELQSDYSNPTPGKGSIEVLSRVGNQAGICHHYYAGDPDTPFVPGFVKLRAYCRYAGRELRGTSAPIELAP